MLTELQVKTIRKEVKAAEERLPLVFNALSDTSRYLIFQLLMRHSDLCVTDIAHVLNVSVPAASQQLKVMEMSGLVKKERDGQMICYRLKKDDVLVKSLMRIANTTSFHH